MITINHDGEDISMINKEEMKGHKIIYPGFTVASLAK
jgi:hypothetical protein